MEHSAKSPRLYIQENGNSGRNCTERICTHEVLQDGGFNSTNGESNKLMKKVIQLTVAILAFTFSYSNQKPYQPLCISWISFHWTLSFTWYDANHVIWNSCTLAFVGLAHSSRSCLTIFAFAVSQVWYCRKRLGYSNKERMKTLFCVFHFFTQVYWKLVAGII